MFNLTHLFRSYTRTKMRRASMSLLALTSGVGLKAHQTTENWPRLKTLKRIISFDWVGLSLCVNPFKLGTGSCSSSLPQHLHAVASNFACVVRARRSGHAHLFLHKKASVTLLFSLFQPRYPHCFFLSTCFPKNPSPVRTPLFFWS